MDNEECTMHDRLFSFRLRLFCFLSWCVWGAAWGQDTGTITGEVRDPSGATVADASCDGHKRRHGNSDPI